MTDLPGLGEVYISGRDDNKPIKKTKHTLEEQLPDKGHIKELQSEQQASDAFWEEQGKEDLLKEEIEQRLAAEVPDWELLSIEERQEIVDNEMARKKIADGKIPVKSLSREEQKALDERFKEEEKIRRVEKAERQKEEYFQKAMPDKFARFSPEFKMTENDPESERLEYFRRYKIQIGKFEPQTVLREFLKDGTTLGPLPKTRILNLTKNESENLRIKNSRVYADLIRKGLKIEGEEGWVDPRRL